MIGTPASEPTPTVSPPTPVEAEKEPESKFPELEKKEDAEAERAKDIAVFIEPSSTKEEKSES